MSKKNLVVVFLLLSGVLVALAYAAGSRSNRLNDSQISFTDKASSAHGNKLTATVWDALMNGLTTRATNHESRLQAFAQVPGYPNLTQQETTFTDLLSTKNANQLTAQMRDGLLSRLTKAVTNHEMRLRQAESATAYSPEIPKVDGQCGTAAGSCLKGTLAWTNDTTTCGTKRTWNCNGANGGTTQACSINNPACTGAVNGKCGTTVGQCSTGKPIAGSAANIWHCEGSNGGTTAYNCQVAAAQYECVGHYDTGRTTERWEGKNARLNCYTRPSGSSARLYSAGCPRNQISGMGERENPEGGFPRFNEFTRGFFDPTATTDGYGGITSANIGCFHKVRENDSDFDVHRDVECPYACRYNQSKHGDKCTKIVTPITESCSGFDQNRCSTTPGCTRQKK